MGLWFGGMSKSSIRDSLPDITENGSAAFHGGATSGSGVWMGNGNNLHPRARSQSGNRFRGHSEKELRPSSSLDHGQVAPGAVDLRTGKTPPMADSHAASRTRAEAARGGPRVAGAASRAVRGRSPG
jgi:hypothetical protein